MALKPTDKILLVVERNKDIEETCKIFHDFLCREINALDILLVDKVINPMFCKVFTNNVPFVGHIFIANGIDKKDIMKCFNKRELTNEDLIKLGLKNG